MTDYLQMERDFIERTVGIIDQYEDLRQELTPEKQYEVTLLLNCLLGLLIYPQQIASKREFQSDYDGWLTDELVVKVGLEWGIERGDIKDAGHKIKGKGENKVECKITVEQLTLRNLIRQMRNAAAHASFYVEGSDGSIRWVEFRDKINNDGFHLVLPVDRLKTFVKKLAESALDRLSKQ